MSDFSDLRQKIDEAKRRLPLSELMAREGLGEHVKKSAHCPFPGHEDKHKSFSVFQGDDGFWHWKCHSRCGDGDEIMFLRNLKGCSLTDAMNLFLDMAGFPSDVPPKSPEYPKSREFPQSHESPKSPECLVSPVYPMSKGQELEKELEALAARNACTERNTARKRRWQLLRDLRAVEVRLARELNTHQLMLTLYEWCRLSVSFLDPKKTPDYYLAAFLAEIRKVRVPTGEGDTIKKALASVSELSDSELPVIPREPDAPESWRRVLALHRQMSRRVGGGTYFLSCRDTAKAFPGLCHQTAYNINLILAQREVIEIVRVGDQRPNGKASQFRYLLSESENGEAEIVA
jgi:CHC2-type zinc finger protein